MEPEAFVLLFVITLNGRPISPFLDGDSCQRRTTFVGKFVSSLKCLPLPFPTTFQDHFDSLKFLRHYRLSPPVSVGVFAAAACAHRLERLGLMSGRVEEDSSRLLILARQEWESPGLIQASFPPILHLGTSNPFP